MEEKDRTKGAMKKKHSQCLCWFKIDYNFFSFARNGSKNIHIHVYAYIHAQRHTQDEGKRNTVFT